MAPPGTLFVMARVPGPVRERLLQALVDGGLDARLGRALYPPRNWHQSLSDLQPPPCLEAMRRACAAIDVPAFDMQLDQLRSSGTAPGHIHWAFEPAAGRPEGLARLLAAVRGGLRTQGLDSGGHRAHVTVSYVARHAIGRIQVPPVRWQVDAVELVQVAGRGADYRYDVVDTWPLRPPAAPAPLQLGLLG